MSRSAFPHSRSSSCWWSLPSSACSSGWPPRSRKSRHAGHGIKSENNFKQIALAFHTYQDSAAPAAERAWGYDGWVFGQGPCNWLAYYPPPKTRRGLEVCHLVRQNPAYIEQGMYNNGSNRISVSWDTT